MWETDTPPLPLRCRSHRPFYFASQAESDTYSPPAAPSAKHQRDTRQFRRDCDCVPPLSPVIGQESIMAARYEPPPPPPTLTCSAAPRHTHLLLMCCARQLCLHRSLRCFSHILVAVEPKTHFHFHFWPSCTCRWMLDDCAAYGA